jgi:hypothetical protein
MNQRTIANLLLIAAAGFALGTFTSEVYLHSLKKQFNTELDNLAATRDMINDMIDQHKNGI